MTTTAYSNDWFHGGFTAQEAFDWTDYKGFAYHVCRATTSSDNCETMGDLTMSKVCVSHADEDDLVFKHCYPWGGTSGIWYPLYQGTILDEITPMTVTDQFVVTRILAENWDEQSGTVNEGGNIGMFGNNDYLKYNNVNFGGVGSAPKANIIRIAYSLSPNNAADGGTLQAAVQPSSSNVTPTLIGTFQPARTSSWGTYVIDTFYISGFPEGVQSLLFTAVTEENLLNLAWFELDYEELTATDRSFIAVKSVQVWRMPRVASTQTTTTNCGSTYESSKK